MDFLIRGIAAEKYGPIKGLLQYTKTAPGEFFPGSGLFLYPSLKPDTEHSA